MLALCLALGLLTWRDAGDEARSAQAVGQLLARLATLPRDESGAQQAVAWVQASQQRPAQSGDTTQAVADPKAHALALRHLRLRVDNVPSNTAPSLPIGPEQRPQYLILEPDQASEFHESLRSAVWILLLVALAGTVVAAILRRRLALVTAALNDWQAQLTAFGQGDRHVRLSQPPFAELHPVSVAFNHLADQLELTLQQHEQLARQALSLRDDERRWISHELHDELAQWLTALSADAALIDRASRYGQPAPSESIAALRQGLADLRQNVRDLLHRLSPHGLVTADLVPALQAIAARWQQRQPGCDLKLELPCSDELRLISDAQASALGAICQEALTNAFRHGTPRYVLVSLRASVGGTRMEIRNDLADASEHATRGIRPGLGSYSMQERARQLGGRCQLGPSPHGHWVVEVLLPPSDASVGRPATTP